jgi:hypothetical protein
MAFLRRVPKAEALGYCQKSLRDENQILVALGTRPASIGTYNLTSSVGPVPSPGEFFISLLRTKDFKIKYSSL